MKIEIDLDDVEAAVVRLALTTVPGGAEANEAAKEYLLAGVRAIILTPIDRIPWPPSFDVKKSEQEMPPPRLEIPDCLRDRMRWN
jgi:hypothetical protein